MPSRLRTSIGTKISFFSFQDIITSVTGILILVTLILTLYLEQSVPVTSEQEQLKQQLSTMLNELTRVTVQNEQRQSSLQTLASSPDAERLRQEIEQWQSTLEQQTNRLTSLQRTLTEREAEAVKSAEKLGLSGLRERAGTIEKELEAQRLTNAVLATEAKSIETQEKELKEKIEKATTEHKLWLLPDTDAAGKQPVLVTVSRGTITSERFNEPGSKREFPASQIETAFAQSLRQYSPARDYVVFYLRPSGIGLFERCLEVSARAGLERGYDAVEEDKQIIFSAPPTP